MTYTRLELTGKRNLHYSKRHRLYGRKLIMFDIDSIEYHHKTLMPVAMFETKFGLVQYINTNDVEFICLKNTSAKLEIPLFCLVYYPLDKDGQLLDAEADHGLLAHIQFLIIPINEMAVGVLGQAVRMTERQLVAFLYRLRGLDQIDCQIDLCDSWKKVPLPDLG